MTTSFIKYYKATFSDGTVVKRMTKARTYTHAWRTVASYTLNHPSFRERNGTKSGYSKNGFCGSEALARTAARYNCNPAYFTDIDVKAEVAPAVEISRAEYRSKS